MVSGASPVTGTADSDSHARATAPTLSSTFNIVDDHAAPYVKDALGYFKFIQGGGRKFDEMVELWQKFEQAAGYPSGQVSSWQPFLIAITYKLTTMIVEARAPSCHKPPTG